VGARAFAVGRLDVEMLPARHGDAILLGWGNPGDRHYMLVDGGPAPAYADIASRLSELGGSGLDLLLLTHVDGDHIEGTILLVNDADLNVRIGEVWCNGSHHLVSELGPVQGEILGALIGGRGIPWNTSFGGAAILTPESEPFPVVDLAGNLRVTVLAPDSLALRRLRDAWLAACKEAGLGFDSPQDALLALRSKPKLSPKTSYLGPEVPDVRQLARSRTGSDRSVANASSLVLLVEYGASRVLLAGDSTPAALTPAVKKLLADRELASLPLTAFKLPHHGSSQNINAELVRLLPSDHFLFSTNGSYFKHPDSEAVATILEYGRPGSELIFNYDNARNRQWDDDRLREHYGYRVRYPAENGSGAVLRLG
jgi:beta-lactamase superfamily II metal-dependent hydrolase